MAAAITASSSTRDVVLAAGAALQQPASRLEPLAAYVTHTRITLTHTCQLSAFAKAHRNRWLLSVAATW